MINYIFIIKKICLEKVKYYFSIEKMLESNEPTANSIVEIDATKSLLNSSPVSGKALACD